MDVNPYEPPRNEKLLLTAEQQAIQKDPLRMPAYGCFFVVAFGVFISLLNVYYLVIAFERIQYQINVFALIEERLFWRIAYLSLMTGIALLVGVSLLKRKRRLLIVAFSIYSFTPFAGCLGATLGFVILYRLWNKDVWNSFDQPTAKDS